MEAFSVKEKTQGFVPFKLTVLFETSDEAAQFYSLFNHYTLNCTTVGEKSRVIREAIVAAFPGVHKEYYPYHEKLCKIIK